MCSSAYFQGREIPGVIGSKHTLSPMTVNGFFLSTERCQEGETFEGTEAQENWVGDITKEVNLEERKD